MMKSQVLDELLDSGSDWTQWSANWDTYVNLTALPTSAVSLRRGPFLSHASLITLSHGSPAFYANIPATVPHTQTAKRTRSRSQRGKTSNPSFNLDMIDRNPSVCLNSDFEQRNIGTYKEIKELTT
jgi:hypothetical protein